MPQILEEKHFSIAEQALLEDKRIIFDANDEGKIEVEILSPPETRIFSSIDYGLLVVEAAIQTIKKAVPGYTPEKHWSGALRIRLSKSELNTTRDFITEAQLHNQLPNQRTIRRRETFQADKSR
ncbi:MAG TPA: hypothetical protein VG347_10885 [Verrucomicrobiae bacterium]|nr:hypothetical protein [Verrucomicrobiae bacterium]